MFQQIAGFTLLEGVLTLTLASITTATAMNHLGDWVSISEETSLRYNRQVASYAMQTHQMWAKAAGKEAPKWQDVISISGINSHISSSQQLSFTSDSKNHCLALDQYGRTLSDC